MDSLSNIESLLFGLLQVVLFTILLAITQNYRYNKRNYVIFLIVFIVFIIHSLSLYYLFVIGAIIYVCLFNFVFFYNKFKLFGIINTLIVIIISVVSDYLSMLTTRYIIDIVDSMTYYFMCYTIIHSFITISIAALIRMLMDKHKLS